MKAVRKTAAVAVILFALAAAPGSLPEKAAAKSGSETAVLANRTAFVPAAEPRTIAVTEEPAGLPAAGQTLNAQPEKAAFPSPGTRTEPELPAPRTGTGAAEAAGPAGKNAAAARDAGKTFLENFEYNGIVFDVYLEDIGGGRKEVVLEYESIAGERKVLKPSLVYDETNQVLSGNDNKGMLGSGFNCDVSQAVFYYDYDVFQRNFGFCELYDTLSPLIFDHYVTARIKFNYDGLDWLIQLWKGRYITTMGAEIGVYNKPESRKIEFYDCGRDEDMMPMSMSVLKGDDTLVFSRPFMTCWWLTGFVFRDYCQPEELTMNASIVFPDASMRDAFTQALDNMTAEGITYSVDGTEVSFIW